MKEGSEDFYREAYDLLSICCADGRVQQSAGKLDDLERQICGDRKGQFFFTFCLADTVSYWIIMVTNLADFYFGGEKYILMFIGRLVLFPLIEWAAVRFLRKPYRELQESAARGWGLFAGMTALYYLLLVVMANYHVIVTKRLQELLSFLFVMALMPMTYATIFTAMYRQLLFFRRQQGERMLLAQKNSLEARLEDQRRIKVLLSQPICYGQRGSGAVFGGYVLLHEERDVYSGRYGCCRRFSGRETAGINIWIFKNIADGG